MRVVWLGLVASVPAMIPALLPAVGYMVNFREKLGALRSRPGRFRGRDVPLPAMRAGLYP
jgi:hypothetical protein